MSKVSWIGAICCAVLTASVATQALADKIRPTDTVARYRVAVQLTTGSPMVSLHVEERGHGKPIILLHGLGGSTYSWRFVAPALARSRRVFAVDLKGFGRSDAPFDTAYSPADQARLICRLIHALGLSDVTLVGHSYGGLVALLATLELNRHTPSRISQIALLDAPALPQSVTPVIALMREPVLPYVLMTLLPPGLLTQLALASQSTRDFQRTYTDDDAEAYAKPYYDAGARHAYIQTARAIAPVNASRLPALYGRIHQPTLLVWCTHDEVVPLATGRALLAMLPHARLEQLARCNHAPTDEAPHSLNRALLKFLSRPIR